MSTEALVQSEVEGLRSATALGGDAITPYDFRRPQRASRHQIRALEMLHEGIGRKFGAALSALLRSVVEVNLTGVDLLAYSEFIFGLENPSCLNLLKAEPLKGNLLLDIGPSILNPIIDRLLGSGREGGPLARRPLTEIELRLVSRITGLFLEELRHAWECILDLNLEVVQVESDPQLVQIIPPGEVVVVVGFELAVGDQRGTMSLGIPCSAIAAIGGKLSAHGWTSCRPGQASADAIDQMGRALGTAPVELTVRLAQTTIGTGELVGLRVGDIITTPKDVRRPVVVSVEGVPKFRARLGVFKGRKAVMVQSTIENPVEALGE